jgi:DNA-binding SARP family transcriptional activator/tetratricopeptide (TPR) repeat protein
MEFRILGAFEVLDADARPVRLPAGRARAVLSLLALHAGRTVASEVLVDELWGEQPPPTVPTIVHGLVSRLRTALGSRAVIETVPPGYRLAVDPSSVDAERFQGLVGEARDTADPAVRARLLSEALGLWRGPALADFRYEPFAQRAITALDELRLGALEDRIEADLACGHHVRLVPELQGLTRDQPYRERLWGLLLLALYRSGRQGEALAAYDEARRLLADQLGVEPAPFLSRLHNEILHQRGSLDLVRRRRSTSLRWLPRERRTVTVVVADLADLAVGVEPEPEPEPESSVAVRPIEAGREAIRRHAGRADAVLGQTVVGFFGLPTAHEDDPLRALRAATDLLGDSPGARIGVETGEVVVGTGEAGTTVGPVVTAAVRLQQEARSGQALVGPRTRGLVSGHAVLAPLTDGRWELRALAPAPLATSPPPPPFVGRTGELDVLHRAFRDVVRTGRLHRVDLTGEPGIGKSRLLETFCGALGSDATVVVGSCPAYGDGLTLVPLHQALDPLLPASDRAELDSGDPFAPAVRFLETLATDRPLVAVFDDLHWAVPTFLDLLDFVTARARGPLLLLCSGRPGLLDRHRGRAPTARAEHVALPPLPPDQVRALAARLAPSGLADGLLDDVTATAGGNPLHTEQLVASLQIDTTPDSDPATRHQVPASLQGLLTMRLDQLGPGERDLLRCASVIEAPLTLEALSALVPEEARPHLDRLVAELVRREFLAQDGGLRFRHALLQRTAYRSITRDDRARLHLAVADWLEDRAATGWEEFAGHHLERSAAERRAVGQDPGEVAVRAGMLLADAGDRAFRRFDLEATANLMSRARALLPSGHPRRAAVTASLAEVCQPLGRFAEADELLAELLAQARSATERAAIRLEQARTHLFLGTDALSLGEILQEAEEASIAFRESGDHAGAARSAFIVAWVHERAGRITSMEEVTRTGLGYAERCHDARDLTAGRWQLARALAIGPTPVDQAIRGCRELARGPHGGANASVLFELAPLLAMAGRVEEARSVNDEARRLLEDRVRARRVFQFVDLSGAMIELLAGNPDGAEDPLVAGLSSARSTGERDLIAQFEAALALLRLGQGRPGEARELASRALASAPADDVLAQSVAHSAAAACALASGDPETAERLSREALRWSPAELPNLRAQSLLGLAACLRDRRPEEAARLVGESQDLYRRKGNLAALRA